MRRQNIMVTVDVVIQKEGEVLLVKRKHAPFKGSWALPGGFMEDNEEVLSAALRELKEETKADLTADTFQFIGFFDAPDRDPRGRVISFAFGTEINGSTPVQAGSDASNAKWFKTHALPELAFDHLTILAHWLEQ
ncbi:MAG: NUDIX domain-containing protein [Owenweeksia sp.]